MFLKWTSKHHHCDPKKGKKEIKVPPTQVNCNHFFRYDLSPFGESDTAGYIIGDNEAAQETISILGLNQNPDLCRRRANVIQQAVLAIRQLKEVVRVNYASKPQILEKGLHQLMNKAKMRAEEKYHEPYFFVKISVYQGR